MPIETGEAYALGLDVGSSSVRATLFDARGREVEGTRARVRSAFTTTRDGGSERDAEALLEDVARVIDSSLSLARLPAGRRLPAVAAASFWHSLVGVDARGRAATPVYGWADTRAAGEAEQLRRELDGRETHARTGCRLHPSYWPAKLRWIQARDPEAYASAARWMSFGEYLTLRLCGETKASLSMASGTGLFDQRLCAWDAPLVEHLGLDPSRLPALARDGEALTLAPAFADRWPPLRGAAFFPPVGDGAANNVGEGCASRERVALMVGTSAAMRVVREGGPPRELHAGLWCYRVDGRRTVVGGALSDGGGLFDWLRETFGVRARVRGATGADVSAGTGAAASAGVDSGEADFEAEAAALEPDAHGLTVLPFWFGERSTGWHPEARGALLGLSADTRPAEIARAALEAVAYRLAHVADALLPHAAPDPEIRASGGALLSSPVWAQIIADVLGRPLHLSRVAEASSRGAVLLALEALGEIKSVSEVLPPPAQTVEPVASRREAYGRGLERHGKFYELLVNDT